MRPVLTATDPGTQQTYEQDWHRWDPNNPFPAEGSSGPRAAAAPSNLFAPPQQNASEAPSAQPDITRFDFQGMPGFLGGPPQVCCRIVRLACMLSRYKTKQGRLFILANPLHCLRFLDVRLACMWHQPSVQNGHTCNSHICFQYAALHLQMFAFTDVCIYRCLHLAALKSSHILVPASCATALAMHSFTDYTGPQLPILASVHRLQQARVGTSRNPCNKLSSNLAKSSQMCG